MPSSLVEVCRPYTGAEEIALMDAVHDSLVTAFKIPPEERRVRLLVHEPSQFHSAEGSTPHDRETRVTVDCHSGRSVQAKRQLHREIVRRLGELGVPAEHLSILVRESGRETRGAVGSQAAS